MAAFSPEEQSRFDEEAARVLARFPQEHKCGALLELLHLVQDILGWVPDEAMPAVAERMGMPLVRVFEVRSFYTMFRLEKPGRHLFEVCTNVSCGALGAEKIVKTVCDRFKLRPGETSADGRVTLQTVECLGSCGTGPMLARNGEYVERIDEEKLQALLEEIERD